ncbi:MAG: beta-lactamase family protein [Phycisphaerales bacterium]|nr:beta-lactamase family protein [Phycisphaerales bacterium]
MTLLPLVAVITALLINTTATPAAIASPDHAMLIERIDKIAKQSLHQPGAAGLSIAVARGDELIIAKGYGLADVAHDVPMTEHTMLRIGSVTKQYTAALILKLVEQDRLGLDDPLTKYIEYPTGDHIVTIRHLLNHTSGIYIYTDVDGFWQEHASRELTPEELLDLFRDKPLGFPPGQRFAYTNTAYYLLGMVIEEITGQTYAEALHDVLLEPLALKSTRYDVSADIVKHRARGYSLGNSGITNAQPIDMRNPGAAGGLMATASDLVRWKQRLVAGTVVDAALFQMMITPTTLTHCSTHSYGFGLDTRDVHDRVCISHDGNINGFSSTLMYFPEDDWHIAVIANSQTVNASMTATRIAAAVLGVEEHADETPLKDLPVPDELIDRITGTYRLEVINLDIRLWGVGDRLFADAPGYPHLRLMYQGGGMFRTTIDPTLRMSVLIASDEPTMASFTLEQGGFMLHVIRVDD